MAIVKINEIKTTVTKIFKNCGFGADAIYYSGEKELISYKNVKNNRRSFCG